MKKIEPRILKGTRDFGPEDMAKRLRVINTMRAVFARYGFDTIETPAIEYAETILGKYGTEGDKLTYTFRDHGDRHIALRYDQTVPTARFVAANWSSLPLPFKRYQIGPVWRADKPQRGRYREFYQCDIDIIGTDSLMADAEIAKVMEDVFLALGVKPFVIRVNSRALLNDLLKNAGVTAKDRTPVIRIIDKLDKLALPQVLEDLRAIPLSEDTVNALKETVLSEQVRYDLAKLPKTKSAQDVRRAFALYKQYGIADEHIMLDLTLARGLDYYTGIIYEVVIPQSGLGSVCGGGRYDNLTGLFSDKVLPGTGVAFGLDRIMVWLEEQKAFADLTLNAEVLIAHFPDTLQESLAVQRELHKAGVHAEIYLEDVKLQKQFKYADKKRIPWMILVGSDEVKKGLLMLKNMRTGEQESLTTAQAITHIRKR